MAKSSAEIVAEMIAGMKVADPELDTSIGSITRKIFDVVAEQIAPAHALTYLSEWFFTIETKSGAGLDDFCAMFGIYRIPAKRAIGVVTFTRPTDAPQNILIPASAQVSTGTTPQIIFTAVSGATIVKGTRSVSVPVQAVVAGESGNLPAGSLTALLSPVSGISGVVQQTDAATGGVNAESDEALRSRFRRTVFRSLAGTEDMFLAVALEDTTPEDALDAQATQANVLGASKRWREQVQVDANNEAVSTIPPNNVKYVYPGSAVFGTDIDSGSILTEGVHFTFDATSSPPKVTSIAGNLEVGTVYDLDFEYVPMASRNEPGLNITNRVDIWVSGVAATPAAETTYFQTTPFTANSTEEMWAGRFIRLSDEGEVAPTVGNLFLPLAWGPILTFPETLSIAGVTYTRDVDYWVVHDDTGYGYGPDSRFGLEWSATSHPAANAQVVLSGDSGYFYNRLPRDVENRARRWKLVTTDLRAHQAKQVRLVLNFALMYQPSYARGVVQAGIDQALATWMNGLGFRSTVQVSDILAVAHGVAGVDNIRLLNSLEPWSEDDPDSWGIQKVTASGIHLTHFASGSTPSRARDIVLAENEVPVLYDVRYETRAQNTYTEPG